MCIRRVTELLLFVASMCVTIAVSARPQLLEGAVDENRTTVIAQQRGAVYALDPHAKLHIEAGTEVRLFLKPRALSLAPGRSFETFTVMVYSGKAVAEVQPGSGTAVILTSRRRLGVAALGGRAGMNVQHTTAAIANLQGEALQVLKGRVRPLGEGWRAVLEQGEAALIEPLLGSVDAKSRHQFYLAKQDNHASIRDFDWRAMEEAAGYELQLFQSGEAEPIHQIRTDTSRLPADLVLKPGQYRVQVRPIDAQGFKGKSKELGQITVLGTELPPGARWSGGALQLPRGKSMRFTHTEGLELIHTGAKRFTPASAAVKLFEDARTLVTLRRPGSLNTIIVALEPLNVYADVHIGPKTATWPRDPLKIRIRLRDERTGTTPEEVQLQPKVLIGIEPVEVQWQRSGNELRGTVAPRQSEGPWVVRVEVTDQHGSRLGRDFVEVIEDPRFHQSPSRTRP